MFFVGVVFISGVVVAVVVVAVVVDCECGHSALHSWSHIYAQ